MSESKRRRDSSDLGLSLSSSSSSSSSIDRLTSLPDTLRLHILSLLPLKSAIRTSSLSSLWRNLWTLRFSQPSLFHLSPLPSTPPSHFISSINSFFSLRNSAPLDSLHITFSPSPSQIPHLKRWLSHADSSSVSDLLLDLSPPPSTTPSSRRTRSSRSPSAPILQFHFRSPTLTRLTLRGFHLPSSPPSYTMFSYSLEILNLCDIYLSYASLRRILIHCPQIRSLSIQQCQDLKKVVVPVSTVRLRKLVVLDCRKVGEISVSALGLRSFRFSGALLKSYSIKCAAMLEDVYISSGTAVPAMPRGDWLTPFGELANLRVLTICSLALESIAALGGRAEVRFRLFPNLVELQLLMMMMAESNLWDVYGFFNYFPCPRLEKLFFELPMNASDPSMTMFLEVPREEPPRGCFSSLKLVKMNGFKGHTNEMELAGVLLANSVNLDNFVVVAPMRNCGGKCESSSGNLLQRVFTELSLLPKASTKAAIILTETDTPKYRPVHSQV